MANIMKFEQTVGKWGNGAAIRLPAKVQKAARMPEGSTVVMEVKDGGLFIRVGGPPVTTLAQKLSRFKPAVHGGEAMAFDELDGAEKF